MPVLPTLTPLSLLETAHMLQGLYLVDLAQLESGIRPIFAHLQPGSGRRWGVARRLRYNRKDFGEVWQTIRDIWRNGGGDCEDLAAAVAAEFTFKGIPARPVIRRVRPGLAHAIVQILSTGQLVDPSKIGGMGTPEEHEPLIRVSGGFLSSVGGTDTAQPGAAVSVGELIAWELCCQRGGR